VNDEALTLYSMCEDWCRLPTTVDRSSIRRSIVRETVLRRSDVCDLKSFLNANEKDQNTRQARHQFLRHMFRVLVMHYHALEDLQRNSVHPSE